MAGATKEPCPLCGGRGWLPVSELSVRDCVCLRRKILAAYLGPELCKASVLEGGKGPLYAINRERWDDPATLDRTTDSLLIHARWVILASHLQLALGHRRAQDQSFRFLLDTDQHLLNVYLGNEHAKWRQSLKGYNSLKDLVEEPDLVIIRLGFIGHTNKAAANVLREAIMIREFANKPTWIAKNPHAAFPISWDEVVASYLDDNFDSVDLTTTDSEAAVPEPVKEEAPGMAVEEQQPIRTPAVRSVVVAPIIRSGGGDSDLGICGEGERKYNKGSKKKRVPGGGPV